METHAKSSRHHEARKTRSRRFEWRSESEFQADFKRESMFLYSTERVSAADRSSAKSRWIGARAKVLFLGAASNRPGSLLSLFCLAGLMQAPAGASQKIKHFRVP